MKTNTSTSIINTNSTHILGTPLATVLERQELIKNYAATHNPEDYEMPKFGLYWKCKPDGKEIYKTYNPWTGEMIETEPRHNWYCPPKSYENNYDNAKAITLSTKSEWEFMVAHYIPELEALEFVLMAVKGNRGKAGEIRKPICYGLKEHFKDSGYRRLFLFKDSNIVYKDDGNLYHPESNGKYYNKDFIEYLKSMNYNVHGYRYSGVTEGIGKFMGYKIVPDGWERNCPWTLYNFIENYKQRNRKPIQQAKKPTFEDCNNALNKIDIRKDIRKWALASAKKEFNTYHHSSYYPGETWVKFICLDGNIGVFRVFKTNYSEKEADCGLRETCRIFVGKELRIYAETYMDRGLKLSSQPIDRLIHNVKNTHYMGLEDLGQIESLKYLKPIIDEYPQSTLDIVVNFIRHPILEKVYKSGYPKLARFLDTDCEVAKNIERIFDTKERKNMSIKDMSDMSTKQLKYVEEQLALESNPSDTRAKLFPQYLDSNNVGEILIGIKDICQVEHISDLDLNKFKENYDVVSTLLNTGRYRSNTWDGLCRDYCYIEADNGQIYTPWRATYKDFPFWQKQELVKACKAIKKMAEPDQVSIVLNTLRDLIGVYKRIDAAHRPEMKIYQFSCLNELYRNHEALNETYAEQEMEERVKRDVKLREQEKAAEERLQKLNKKREEIFGFEDDTYKIVIPQHLQDLRNEGSRLRHCVSGYTDRIANGRTNILFLRKKEDIDTSFYTIEVDNNMRLVQCHSLCNKWIGNNPEAIPFMKTWLEEKGIKYDPHILLCTSGGYSSNGVYLDGTPYGLPNYNK